MEVFKTSQNDYEVLVTFWNDSPGTVLHWAVDDWNLPDRSTWPPGSNQAGDKAVQTPVRSAGQALTFHFPASVCPSGMVFVVRESQPQERWVNQGGSDFRALLKPPGIESVASKVLAAEGEYTHWSLKERFSLVMQVMDAANAAGPEGMALLAVWLRLSAMRQLDWYRRANYQPKDMAHMQQVLAERMAALARDAAEPRCREYARICLGTVPRGDSRMGDAIRLEILNIMRGNGIKEGHRPGLDEPFLEQWHQKLHQNTTPDDVLICRAYIAHLESGGHNHDAYWGVLNAGGLTKERMESWSNPIRAWPMHLPHLINPMKHYLWILECTHSGNDLDTAKRMAEGHLDNDLNWHLWDLLQNRHEPWVPYKAVELRERVGHAWRGMGGAAARDVGLLDVSLEQWFALSVNRLDVGSLNGDQLLDLCAVVLRNALATDGRDEDAAACLEQLNWLRSPASTGGVGPAWSPSWAAAALAVVERMQVALAQRLDAMYQEVQPYAEQFRDKCKLDPQYITNFGEELVRSQPLAGMSRFLQRLQPILR
eukprot:CAMPEP_0202911472 /NCGR_PEP_ID=MMETSP1392-20130828/55031_1 /ASSEMBLY_ACC=CAM_ASM_000868 /TAXON_ID=225041 /ORGANISM="Chlamydomonas chlamydogama, Strain SAG 11-48b" /LENGTH=539 /DNA_ID=CAMNT_0049601977 /DNA_START=269 /DNA_END=1885 /DNA_ORIENTATION=+